MFDILWAVGLDLLIGDPPNFPHPIRLMGTIIDVEEKWIRGLATSRRALFFGGGVIVLTNLLLAFSIPYGLLKILQPYPFLYHLVNVYVIYTCLAAKCLRDEAMNIYTALKQGIEQARYRLSFIVGRETSHLDEPEIIRATVETVAENTSDGIIAPLLYAIIGGAPLIVMYKMVNTMDSMLGYMNEKYRDLGYFPAKVDDMANYIPARLTGIFMNVGCLVPAFETMSSADRTVKIFWFHILDGFRIMIRDRNNHKSPNCAYPEGALAGLLGVQLGGDNVYFGQIVKKPTIGETKKVLENQDIPRSIAVMFRAEIVCVLGYLLVSM